MMRDSYGSGDRGRRYGTNEKERVKETIEKETERGIELGWREVEGEKGVKHKI